MGIWGIPPGRAVAARLGTFRAVLAAQTLAAARGLEAAESAGGAVAAVAGGVGDVGAPQTRVTGGGRHTAEAAWRAQLADL